MENHVRIDTYQSPSVLGSFDAQDVIGAADGSIGGSILVAD